MVQQQIGPPPLEFLEFANSLAQQVSGGQGRLNTADAKAPEKLMKHIDQQATNYSEQAGVPKESVFEQIMGGVGKAANSPLAAIAGGPPVQGLQALNKASQTSLGQKILQGANRSVVFSPGVIDTIKESDIPLSGFLGFALNELTNPINIATTALLASGVGAPAGLGLKAGASGASLAAARAAAGAGASTGARFAAGRAAGAAAARVPLAGAPAAKLAGSALQPINTLGTGFLPRLAAEQAVSGGALAGGAGLQQVGQQIPGPTRSLPGQVALGLGGGLVGAGATAGALQAGRAGLRRGVDTVSPVGRAEALDPDEAARLRAQSFEPTERGTEFVALTKRDMEKIADLRAEGGAQGKRIDAIRHARARAEERKFIRVWQKETGSAPGLSDTPAFVAVEPDELARITAQRAAPTAGADNATRLSELRSKVNNGTASIEEFDEFRLLNAETSGIPTQAELPLEAATPVAPAVTPEVPLRSGDTPVPIKRPTGELPTPLRRNIPKKNGREIQFSSDIDKAFYIVGSPGVRQTTRQKFTTWLEGLGFSRDEIDKSSLEMYDTVQVAGFKTGDPGVIPRTNELPRPQEAAPVGIERLADADEADLSQELIRLTAEIAANKPISRPKWARYAAGSGKGGRPIPNRILEAIADSVGKDPRVKGWDKGLDNGVIASAKRGDFDGVPVKPQRLDELKRQKTAVNNELRSRAQIAQAEADLPPGVIQEPEAVATVPGTDQVDLNSIPARDLTSDQLDEALRLAGQHPTPEVRKAGVESEIIKRRGSLDADDLRNLTDEELNTRLFETQSRPKGKAFKLERDEILDEMSRRDFKEQWQSDLADEGLSKKQTTQRVNEILRRHPDTPLSEIDEIIQVREAEISAGKIGGDDGGAGKPPRASGTGPGSSDEFPQVASTWRGLNRAAEAPVHEKPIQTILRQWEGARNFATLQLEGFVERGNKMITELDFPTRRTPETEKFMQALHGDIPISAVRSDWHVLIRYLKHMMNASSRDMRAMLQDPDLLEDDALRLFGLDADAFLDTMAAHPDYFPQGWLRPPRVEAGSPSTIGQVGNRPGFSRMRMRDDDGNIVTYTQKLFGDAALEIEPLEPSTWNPVAMMARRYMAGVEYQEQVVLLNALKQRGLIVPVKKGAGVPDGWAVPEVGPAFEGRPVATGDDGHVIFSDRYAVPANRKDRFVNKQLEAMFGSGGDLGHLEWMKRFSNAAKRLKLFASLFQHVDISTRAAGALSTPTSIRAGSEGIGRFPSMAKELVQSQWSPNFRNRIRADLLTDKPIFKDGNFEVSGKLLVEEGWGIRGDTSVIQREFQDMIKDVVAEAPESLVRRAAGRIKQFNDFWEKGLFEGVYLVGQKNALQAHFIRRIHLDNPDWTPRQVAAAAADQVNTTFSSLGSWQTVFRFAGRELREIIRALIFSTNESEGLIKGAIRGMRGAPSLIPGVTRGGQDRGMAEFYIGTFVALAAIANVVHFTATGKVLPSSSYSPIDTDDAFAPFGVGYENRFLSPQVPFIKSRGGLPAYMDIVGQMDTAFRWGLDPLGALSSRVNVIPRAIQNQLGQGENFFGEPLQTPGQRIGQGALDLGAPIGAQAVVGGLSEAVPGLQQVFPAAESRLGVGGQFAQATGINFRTLKNQELRDLKKNNPEMAGQIDEELDRRGVEFARRDPRSIPFTTILEARLADAIEQGDALAARSIRAEIARRAKASGE